MPHPRILSSWPVRKKLLLLTLIVFLPAAGIIIASGVDQRAHEISKAKDNARLLVQSLIAQQEQIAVGIEQTLSTLAQLPQVQRLDAVACGEIFRDLLNRHPFYSTIGATTPDGKLFASDVAFEPASIDLSDRKYIKDTIASLEFSAGEYQVGRVTKVPSINYSYPVLDDDGNLTAIVIAGFRLDGYAGFIKKANLPEGSAVLITDHNGVRLYRVPENDAAALGKPPSGGFKQIADLDEGFYERTADDGVFRIYAFKRLRLREGSPPYLNMIVGVSKEKILHEANLKMLSNLSILVLVAFIAMSLAWLLGDVALTEPINQLVTTTRRLGRGEIGTRTGLLHSHDELGRLAKSFDDMATLLEAKDMERRRAQEALVESEARYRAVVEDQTELITRFSPEGVVTFVNKANCRYFGVREEEFLGHTFWHLVPEEDHDRIKEQIDSLDTEKPTGMIEHRCRAADGEIRWLQWVNRAIFDDQGQIVEYQGVGRDITNLKLAQETLTKATQRLQLAVTSGQLGIWEWDIRLGELTWDDGMLKLYGITKESFPIRYESWERALHPEDRAKTKADLQAALRGEAEYDTEFRVVHPDGTIKVLKTNGVVIREANGKPTRMIGLNRDVTERKLAEEALRESEREKAAILSGLTDVIVMFVDPNIRLIWANAAFEKASCLSVEEMKGKRCFEAVRGLQEPCPGCTVLEAAASGEFQEGEVRFPDGMTWIVGNNPIRGDNGKVTGVVHVAVNITRRKRAEEALRQSEEKYRMLFEHSPLGIFHFDKKGIVTACNENLVGILCSSKEKLIGLNLSTYLRDEAAIAAFSKCLSGKRGHYEGYYRSATGTVVKPLKGDYAPIFSEDGSISGGMAIVEDISERMQAQEALQESEEQLRFLSSRLLSAQEEERKKIASEIHDSLGSSLSAVKMGLENARRKMEEGEPVAAFLDTPILCTQFAIDEARRLMTDLRPSILDDLGLLAATGWLLRQQRTIRPSIYIEADLDIEESDIPEPLKIVIFRIMQEAFQNISKYSRAELVSFSLAKRNGAIELAIEDNGMGFDVHATLHARRERRGLGLTSMKERAELSGGSFSIESIPEEGCTCPNDLRHYFLP